ncbi:MAG: hypothetical protein AB4426_30785 [Xenococcaceae cyanobacterium]
MLVRFLVSSAIIAQTKAIELGREVVKRNIAHLDTIGDKLSLSANYQGGESSGISSRLLVLCSIILCRTKFIFVKAGANATRND